MIRIYYSDNYHTEKQCVELPYKTVSELTTAFLLLPEDQNLELVTINLK